MFGIKATEHAYFIFATKNGLQCRSKLTLILMCTGIGRMAMAYLNGLSSYQAKVLRIARTIVELDRAIESTIDAQQREKLARHAGSLRAMLRVYKGMVSFLICCIELEHRANARESSVEIVKHG